MCLGGAVEEDAVLLDSGGIKIVGDGAKCDHQVVVVNTCGRKEFYSIFIAHGRQDNLPRFTINTGHIADAKVEIIGDSVAAITHSVDAFIHGADSQFMQ